MASAIGFSAFLEERTGEVWYSSKVLVRIFLLCNYFWMLSTSHMKTSTLYFESLFGWFSLWKRLKIWNSLNIYNVILTHRKTYCTNLGCPLQSEFPAIGWLRAGWLQSGLEQPKCHWFGPRESIIEKKYVTIIDKISAPFSFGDEPIFVKWINDNTCYASMNRFYLVIL